MSKPILCLDFDGVLHSYASGWKGATVIPDPPVPGALEFLLGAKEEFDVQIFSSRSNHPGGIPAMAGWLAKHFGALFTSVHGATAEVATTEAMKSIGFPTTKPPAMVSIDDRCLTFTGEWPTIAALLAFKPWNKKG